MFGIALCLLALGSSEVRADSPGTGSISIIPANSAPRGVQLRSQTVNVAINEDVNGAWADTDLWVQLHNRSAAPVVIPIGIPGPQVSAAELPDIIEATVDGRSLALTRVADPNKPEIRATALITVPVRGDTDIRVRYRQALPTQSGLVNYVYLLTAGHVWAGAPESLRVSITFTPPLPPEQILHLAPASHSQRPGVFMWEWGGVKAPSSVGLAFMSSEWWRKLETERTAAAAPEVGLARRVALGERYWHLATLAPPAFAPRASFYNRYFSLALAEFRAGVAASGPDTAPVELAAVRERLAGLYLAEGNREGRPASQTYLQLAATELAAAVTLNPSDAELRASATALQKRLTDAARARGDQIGASNHVARLQALAAGRAAPTADERAQNEALGLAHKALAAGDFAAARRLLRNAFGADILDLDDGAPPRVTQSLLHVSNTPGQRTVTVQLLDANRGTAAAEVITAAVTALRGLTEVKSSSTALTITLAYSEPATLLGWQDRLHAALPDLPELALLSAALSTRYLAWPVKDELLTRFNGYEERVDLGTSSAAWRTEALKLERAAKAAELTGQSLDQLRAAIWRADARAWLDVAAHSRATYQTEVYERGGGPDWLRIRVHRLYREGALQREWVVRAGEVRQLEAGVLAWRYDRVVLTAGAVLLLGALVSLGAWTVSRSRSEPV